ncbi:4'-phosphopantetheinyl transferase superfamily protein [Cellulomonas fimi]|uniref:4'-phosphopantetheinyl transferase superfamily protein n=1 Tax=Cellulomonas fimi TaxID=1708 RepID=A0A7Y0QHV8_CELFI|nr:4'-phosphopantetheinyl transferase superfamily protein [Cellulomonas fimi]NMR20700.1 4'-phosphopantetheinyl transferase superfamily protein [Cellulomonas fimi]
MPCSDLAADVWLLAPGDVDPALGLALLDDAERARAARLAGDRRTSFVAARALLRSVVGTRLGCRPQDAGLAVRCPVCGGADHGPVAVVAVGGVRLGEAAPHVSISRTGPRIAVALASRPVGVDVVSVADVARSPFDDVALAPAEVEALASLTGEPLHEARARAWARKEAALKALGTGLTTDPRTVDVRDVAARAPAGDWVVIADAHSAPGEAAAVAVALGEHHPRSWPPGGILRLDVAVHGSSAQMTRARARPRGD